MITPGENWVIVDSRVYLVILRMWVDTPLVCRMGSAAGSPLNSGR